MVRHGETLHSSVITLGSRSLHKTSFETIYEMCFYLISLPKKLSAYLIAFSGITLGMTRHVLLPNHDPASAMQVGFKVTTIPLIQGDPQAAFWSGGEELDPKCSCKRGIQYSGRNQQPKSQTTAMQSMCSSTTPELGLPCSGVLVITVCRFPHPGHAISGRVW
jgi:hypothetical protein